MHPYGTEFKERVRIFVALIPIAFIISGLVLSKLNEYRVTWPPILEFLADPTSAAFVYVALLWMFDRWIWRFSLLHRLGIVNIPDLNGDWSGELRSSYNGFDPPYA